MTLFCASCESPGPPAAPAAARSQRENAAAGIDVAAAPVEGGPERKKRDENSATAVIAPAIEPGVRKFTFHYQFRVKNLSSSEATDLVRVWLPCPSTTECQEVTTLPATAPAKLTEHKEARHGNRLLYFELSIPEEGSFNVDVPYEIVRREVLNAGLAGGKEQLDDESRAMFLAADKLVPTAGRPLQLLAGLTLKQDLFSRARQLYDVVDDHVTYKKEGTGWGRGDTNWVCDSGYGNCTDFHSLFISLARSQGLPSRFEIGFSIPTDRSDGPISGYHCWGWFHLPERGWVPVDISEADKHPELKDYYFGNLTADRVMFSTGRDLELIPESDAKALNFFIYPHIEVGGEPLPKENVELQFSFREN